MIPNRSRSQVLYHNVGQIREQGNPYHRRCERHWVRVASSLLITVLTRSIHNSRATALKLADQGGSLSLCDINEDAVSQVVRELAGAGKHTYFQCDVGSSARCEAAIEHTLSQLGKIDFVFNCAGINPTALEITDTTDDYFDKLVNTNLRGPFNITRTVVPHLKPGAAIVNVSSTAGLRATNGFSIVSYALHLPQRFDSV